MKNSLNYTGNQNNEDIVQNRGLDTRIESTDVNPISITLQTIDESIINYFSDVVKPSITVGESIQRVPVLYGNAERWASFRKDGFLRAPSTDKALTPMIMIRRTSMEVARLSNPSNKYISTSYQVGWNARNPYDKFTASNRISPSKQFYTVMIPDYVDLSYDVVVWTEYEEQMSSLLGQIQVESDEYWGERNNFKFRVKIDSMENQTEINAAQDRIVRTTFSIQVGAYLIPERMVKDAKIISTNKKTYTAKKIVTLVELKSDRP